MFENFSNWIWHSIIDGGDTLIGVVAGGLITFGVTFCASHRQQAHDRALEAARDRQNQSIAAMELIQFVVSCSSFIWTFAAHVAGERDRANANDVPAEQHFMFIRAIMGLPPPPPRPHRECFALLLKYGEFDLNNTINNLYKRCQIVHRSILDTNEERTQFESEADDHSVPTADGQEGFGALVFDRAQSRTMERLYIRHKSGINSILDNMEDNVAVADAAAEVMNAAVRTHFKAWGIQKTLHVYKRGEKPDTEENKKQAGKQYPEPKVNYW
jgi:hypothetical protein